MLAPDHVHLLSAGGSRLRLRLAAGLPAGRCPWLRCGSAACAGDPPALAIAIVGAADLPRAGAGADAAGTRALIHGRCKPALTQQHLHPLAALLQTGCWSRSWRILVPLLRLLLLDHQSQTWLLPLCADRVLEQELIPVQRAINNLAQVGCCFLRFVAATPL